MHSIGAPELLLILLIIILFVLVVLIPYWRIFSKAGFSPWLSLLMLVPLANIVMLYFLGFSDWPSLKEKNSI
jgi:uncharacterized membrane protein YhaH (DUF805 family)